MSSITTRAGKGSALTHNEVDANFTNLNTDKAELTGANNFTNATGQTFRRAATQDGILIRGRAGGTSSYRTEITPTTLTANRTITLPNSDGTVVTTGDTGTVTSTMIADGTIVNADINASAAIAHSKLASVTAGSVLLGNSGNVATSTALTGDVTVNSSGVTAIGSGVIVDADISASAGVAVSKLAYSATPNALLRTNAAGTGVEWGSNIFIPGSLDVNANAAFYNSATFGTVGSVNTNIILNGIAASGNISVYGWGVSISAGASSGLSQLYLSADQTTFGVGGGFEGFSIYPSFTTRRFLGPTARNTTTTLATANLYNGIITSTTAAAVNLTLPTGINADTDLNALTPAGSYQINASFEWSIINTGATNSVTLIANTGHTIVGSAVVTAGNSGRFMTQKTATNTFVTYRISS